MPKIKCKTSFYAIFQVLICYLDSVWFQSLFFVLTPLHFNYFYIIALQNFIDKIEQNNVETEILLSGDDKSKIILFNFIRKNIIFKWRTRF